MSKYFDWVQIEIPKPTIEKFRQIDIDWKQNINKEVQSRWSGLVGEYAFDKYCRVLDIPFQNLTHIEKSPVDFIIGNKKIDLKTVASMYFPKDNYACNISPKQHYRNKEVDTYVFARFVTTQNLFVLLGWIDKKQFEKNCITRMAGSKSENTFVPTNDMFELEILMLNPIASLWQGEILNI